jgi:LEA14-like dessication related protein
LELRKETGIVRFFGLPIKVFHTQVIIYLQSLQLGKESLNKGVVVPDKVEA